MKLFSIDLDASFNEGGPGCENKSIIDNFGEIRLSRKEWEIGKFTYESLKSEDMPDFKENFDGYCEVAAMMAREFIDPLVTDLVSSGQLEFKTYIDFSFPNDWLGAGWGFKIINFLKMLRQSQGHLSLLPNEFSAPFTPIILATLMATLDVAACAERLGNGDLRDHLDDVYFLHEQLVPDPYVQAIAEITLKRRGKSGADKTNAEHDENRKFVYDWLDANYIDGDKTKDLAERLHPLLDGERDIDTLKKDVPAWKKLRGKPLGKQRKR